jgi:hypothetical protein
VRLDRQAKCGDSFFHEGGRCPKGPIR